MKPHKWAKEIKAWADGAEIEYKLSDEWHTWIYGFEPHWDIDEYEYRIKPQPKEPQYLYVYRCPNGWLATGELGKNAAGFKYIGKIKLEQDDE